MHQLCRESCGQRNALVLTRATSHDQTPATIAYVPYMKIFHCLYTHQTRMRAIQPGNEVITYYGTKKGNKTRLRGETELFVSNVTLKKKTL